jgi:hypothetical protein
MTTDTTQAVWITRQRTTVRHIRGLLQQLEAANALDYATVKIFAVEDDRAVELPGGGVVSQDNLPPQGILIVPASAR